MKQVPSRNVKKRLNDPQFAKHGRQQSFAFQGEAMESYMDQSQSFQINLDIDPNNNNNNNNTNDNDRKLKNIESLEQQKQANNTVFPYAVPQNYQKRESNVLNQQKNENEQKWKAPIIRSANTNQQHQDLIDKPKSLEEHDKNLQEISYFNKEEEEEEQQCFKILNQVQEVQSDDFILSSSSKQVGTNDYSSFSSTTSNMTLSQKQKLKEQKNLLKNPLFRHITKQHLPRIDPSFKQTTFTTHKTTDEQNKDKNQYFSQTRDQPAKDSINSIEFQKKLLLINEETFAKQQKLENLRPQGKKIQFDSDFNYNQQQVIQKASQPNIQKEIQPNQINELLGLEDDDRSRQRTEKQKNNYKYRQSEKEREIFDSHPLGEKMKRSMNDIQGQQLRTSYALTKKSFKWSSKVKTLLFSKKRTQDMQPSMKQVANEVYEDLDYQQDQDYSSKNSIEMEEEEEEQVGEIGELNKYKMKVLRPSQKASTVEKGFKFKQNRQMREIQKGIFVFQANNQLSNIETSNNEASEALLEFLGTLSQKGDLRTSVENFGEAMTLFFQLKEQFQQGINNESFVLSASIGEGSFGQVDLYFLKANSQLQSNFTSNSLKETASQSDAKILSLAETKQPSTIQMSVNFSQDNQISNLQSQIQQMQQINADSGLFDSIKPITGLTIEESNQIQIEQSIPFGEENGKQIFQKCMPVAGKKIKNLDEFTRELFIMQNVKCEYMPKLIFADLEKQLLYMELGLCSLEELKQDSDEMGYNFSDEFTYQILVQIIKAIESLLNHIDIHSNKPRPLFHSDIKPSNIMLTVKKYPGQPNCSLKLLLIDFGGASFAIDDYWAFFTPAFVCSTLYQKLVQNQHISFHLSWEEIRFAEVYAACRSVQFLLIPDTQKHLFQQENYEQFLQEKSYLYPKTCSILSAVFRNQVQQPLIRNIYETILSPQDKSLYTGLNPQNISFESQKIFQLSKFYTVSASKQQN